MAPGLRMPRIAMHRCSASITTIAPRGSSLRTSASAICVVSRSCTCGRLAYRSTSRASLDSPVTRPSRRDVADVRHAEERHQVVLARRVHRDVPHQDQLVVVLVEGPLQHRVRVDAQAGELLRVGAGHPGRGVRKALPVRVLAARDQQLPHRRLGPGLVEVRRRAIHPRTAGLDGRASCGTARAGRMRRGGCPPEPGVACDPASGTL